MGLLERLSSDFAYLKGVLRVLKRTTPIGKNKDRSLRELIEEKVALYRDRPALVGVDETLTYDELDRRANRYARWAMAKGVGKGDVVALFMPNRPDYLAIWLGVAKAGGVTALVNTHLHGDSLGHSIAVVGAKFAIVDVTLLDAFKSALPRPGHPGKLAADFPVYLNGGGEGARFDEEARAFSDAPLSGAERRALTIEDRCILIYTSGTTGRPVGVSKTCSSREGADSAGGTGNSSTSSGATNSSTGRGASATGAASNGGAGSTAGGAGASSSMTGGAGSPATTGAATNAGAGAAGASPASMPRLRRMAAFSSQRAAWVMARLARRTASSGSTCR